MSDKPERYWNYRIIESPAERGDERYYGIHEVHYEGDKPWGYSEHPTDVVWGSEEGLEAGKEMLTSMLKAFDKPVLMLEDFK